MSVAVIGWQVLIFLTIIFSGRARSTVIGFWVIWTVIQVGVFWLSAVQFLTIAAAYAISREK